MDTKLVSVIMPAYNGGKYIRRAIESVLAQTYSKLELIIVDDGSTDNTASIIRAYEDPRIRYIYQKNRGQAAALNRGLDLAQGAYITTLDVDDWFTPISISERVNFLDLHPEFGVVYGDGMYCEIDGKPLMRFSEYRVGDVVGDVYDVLINNPFFGTGGNVMVRRNVFDKYNIRYDESIVWCQDYDIYIRIAEHVSFGVIDAVTIWYCLHETNMTMTMPTEIRFESYLRMKNKVLASPRFLKISTSFKVEFFYNQILTCGLAHRLDDQMALAKDDHFRSLPRQQQAWLLRLAANHYISIGENAEFARTLLGNAWSLQPINPKTILSLILAYLNPDLAKWITKKWQQLNTEEYGYKSPISMIKKTERYL